MNLNTLKYMIAVSEERSFTRAAQRLAVSQPTLSLNVKSLETRLGTPLFDRTTYPLTLTPAGKLYIEWARSILLSEAELIERIHDANDSHSEVIRIGTSPHRANTMLVNILKAFKKECPDCRIDVTTDTTAETYQMLEDGNLDFILEPATDADKAKYNVRFLQDERVLIAVPKACGVTGLPAADGGDFPSIRMFQLKDHDFICMKSDTFLGRTLLEICRAENFIPRASACCSRVETAGALAAAGLGVALLSELYVCSNKNIADTLDFFTIAGASPARNLSLIHANGLHLNGPFGTFIELCIGMYGSPQ